MAALALARMPTLRGLAPCDDDEIADADIVEIDGVPPSGIRFVGSVSVPPASRPAMGYSLVVPRGSRKKTLRLDE